MVPVTWPRRVATLENPTLHFMRRSATRGIFVSHRGLKPTATIASSLRDARFALLVSVLFIKSNCQVEVHDEAAARPGAAKALHHVGSK